MTIRMALAMAALPMLVGCDAIERGIAQTAPEEIELSEYPDQLLFGDTHLHTDNSIDAFGYGTRLGPEEALRFARGETVTSTTGIEATLDRPLDFLVIADHSDGLGATRRIYDLPAEAIADPTLRRWRDMMHAGPEQSQQAIGELITAAAQDTLPDALRDPERQRAATRDIWQAQLETLERFNQPGRFSALAGFEWTLMPGGNNLHRVVMFRDGSDRTMETVPFPGLDTTVEDLWDWMDRYEKATGGRVMAIPHNSNLSNGMMFETTKTDGTPIDAAYARRRARHEPVVEVTQIKGDSETHAALSPNDEFAGFGTAGWQLGNLPLTAPAEPGMLPGSYVRSALKRGLTIEERTGANPYRFGLIGSTDSHTALATGDEDNFFGKHTALEPSAGRAMQKRGLGSRPGRVGWHYLAGGYAGVWARGNTRAEIFDAFARREVFATTGPRMSVRLFGGYGLAEADFTSDAHGGDWVRGGYERAVPMGGVLEARGEAPSFLVEAMKDPEGANLDRVQIVKGWTDGDGTARERIYDVAWSEPRRRRMMGGTVPPVGDTVDRANATYTNTIGSERLRAAWIDPDYEPGQHAFYYVRALEIPTPRWVLYDALRFGLDLPEEVIESGVAQERAYSSPIWIAPKRRS